jgi:hypothetical protein
MKELKVEKLTFERGDNTFSPDEFAKVVGPYFTDLSRVGRTNFLFAAVFGDGSKPEVTGYRTNTTINATINQRALAAQKSGGKWAVYRLE